MKKNSTLCFFINMSSADDAQGRTAHAVEDGLSAQAGRLMDSLLESPSEQSTAFVMAYARQQLKNREQHDA